MTTPADFHRTLLDEAYRLRSSVMAVSRLGVNLERSSALWVIRLDAWKELRRHQDYSSAVQCQPNRLFNLPVRLTIDDDPDTPMIQLLMEPQLWATATTRTSYSR